MKNINKLFIITAALLVSMPMMLFANGEGGEEQSVTVNTTRPFPQAEEFQMTGTVIKPNVAQTTLDNDIKTKYNDYKSRYLKSVGQYYYILASGNGPGGETSLAISEAHGYGMIIFALMAGYDSDAKKYFDGMNNFRKNHNSVNKTGLMSWYVKTIGQIPSDGTSATDGDLDNAYALLLAYKQWGDEAYLNEAKSLINTIKTSSMHQGTLRPSLGDWDKNTSNTRSSDWRPGHFRAFYEATEDNFWLDVASNIYTMIGQISNPTTGLIPDFVTGTGAGIKADPTGGGTKEKNAEHYYYNACRDPLFLALDYAHHGTAEAKTQIDRISSWLRGSSNGGANGNPDNIKAGYQLDGSTIPKVDWTDVVFNAPFAAGMIANSANQAFLNSTYTNVKNSSLDPNNSWWEEYWNEYKAGIQLLSMLLISGNWWAPEELKDDNPKPIEYTVSFNSNGGSAVSTQNITSGNTATKPTNPTRTGYNFDNWYENSQLTTLFNFANAITADITIYAKWTPIVTIDICEICNKQDCETDHILCVACGNYDCEKSICEICNKHDCDGYCDKPVECTDVMTYITLNVIGGENDGSVQHNAQVGNDGRLFLTDGCSSAEITIKTDWSKGCFAKLNGKILEEEEYIHVVQGNGEEINLEVVFIHNAIMCFVPMESSTIVDIVGREHGKVELTYVYNVIQQQGETVKLKKELGKIDEDSYEINYFDACMGFAEFTITPNDGYDVYVNGEIFKGEKYTHTRQSIIDLNNDDVGHVEIRFQEKGATSINGGKKSDNGYGIIFTKNIVSQIAEFSVVLPKNEKITEAKVAIYDMTGNVVYRMNVNIAPEKPITWDLTNSTGRFVANGTYLTVVEATASGGQRYYYSAKLGVRR